MEALKKLLEERFNLSNKIGAAMILQQEANDAKDKIDARINQILDPRLLVASTLEFDDLPASIELDKDCLLDMIENEPGYSEKIEQMLINQKEMAGEILDIAFSVINHGENNAV